MSNCFSSLCMCAVVVLFAFPSDALGVLFRDQMTDPNDWGKNASSSDHTATWNYDYDDDGIPEAPSFEAGDAATRGLKMEANNTDFFDSVETFAVYPLGQNFTGNYQLKFDAWQNYSTFDREQDGGNGTTEFLGGGIGYDNTQSTVGVSGAGHQIITTGEGGSGSDYRAFKGSYYLAGGEMACGSRNATGCGATGPYEVLFPAGSGVPPAAQGQTGSPNENRGGSSGFQWYIHTVSVSGTVVRHQMRNNSGEIRNIAVYDVTELDPNNVESTDGNISIVYADFFNSISPSASLTFGLVDNVTVSDTIAGDFDFDGDVDGNDFLLYQQHPGVGPLNDWQTNYGMSSLLSASAAVPEPTSSLLALAALCLAMGRRR